MAVMTFNMEKGIQGNPITTSFSEASDTPMESVSVTGTGASFTYDNTHAIGLFSSKNVLGPSLGGIYVVQTIGLVNPHYGRMCLYQESRTSGVGIFRSTYTGNNHAASGYLNSDGTIEFWDTVAQQCKITVPIVLNQWNRLEWRIFHSQTVGQIEIKLFTNIASTAPDQIVTSAANLNTGPDVVQTRWGAGAGNSTYSNVLVWIDSVVTNASSYPGPIIPPGDTMVPMGMIGMGRV